jgi:hypothetical protein
MKMPAPVRPPAGGEVNLPPIKWDGNVERLKCRAGGRRMRTACKTIAPSDRTAFLNGQVARYLVSERASDMQRAWGLPVTGDIDAVAQYAGLSYADIAEAHADAFVPICLAIEGGRHTCHPESSPGRQFYDQARATFEQQVRNGRIRFRHTPRGGGAGADPGTDPTGHLPFPGGPQSPAGGGNLGLLAIVALGAFLIVKG